MTHLSSSGRSGFGWLSRLAWSGSGVAAALVLALATCVPSALRAQTGTVSGRVTETGGGPISGAQVSVQGTNLGVTTGDDGRFTLVVPAGARVLRVLAIGFKVGQVSVNVAPGGSTTANAELTRSVLSLDEVVVTGTGGATAKRELGNSITAISLAAEVKDPPASMDQLLQARTAGMSVIQTGASAGSGAQIRLRGVVSVNQSNQPIVYIDGIRVRSEGYVRNGPPSAADFTGRGSNIQSSPLNDINPNDIDRIEIIKGAAAATLYGTEASAGVIQIFTKKGSRGTRPRWNIETDQGMAQTRPLVRVKAADGTLVNPYLNLKPRDSVIVVTDGAIADAYLSVVDTGGAAATAVSHGQCYPTPIAVTDASGNKVKDAQGNTAAYPCDWVRNGYRQRYSASVTGGFDQFQYFASGAYENDNGVMPQDNETKLTTRGNFSFDVSEKLRLELNSAYTHDDIVNTPSGNNAQGLILNVYRWERNYRSTFNPYTIDSILNQTISTGINRLVTGGSAYYTPLSWFSNRFTIGYDFAQQENRALRPFGFVSQPLGRVSDQQNTYSILTFDYAGNMDYRFSPTLAGTFSFGGQSVTNSEIGTNSYGSDFPGPGDPVVSSAATFIAEERRVRTVNAGFFFQNVFKLKDRYFLTTGIRFDGNTSFGECTGSFSDWLQNCLQVYPKVSGSYVLSDESFWPRSLGEMKLRAAVGYAGRAPGAFDKLRTWSPTNSVGIPAFLPNNVGDTLVGPERTRETELGADWGLLGGRLAIEATYYSRRTTDALFNVRQIPSLGFLNSRRSNVGTIGSNGIELSGNLHVLDKAKFGWEVGGSVFTNHSKVLSLCKGDACAAPFASSTGWVQGPDTLSDGTILYFPLGASKGAKIKNKNEIAPADSSCVPDNGELCAIDGEAIFGPNQPTLILGMNSTLRLPGNITLSARGEVQKGAYIYDGPTGNSLSRSVLWPTCLRANGILLPVASGGLGGTVNDLTAWERTSCLTANHNFNVHYYKADFFKIRDVTLSVPLNSVFRQVENATVRASVQNFWRWYNSDLPLFDPEMTDRDALDEQGRTLGEHVPPPATLTLSLRVTF
jgi:TonB-linked SusC/RagA family outer membrane protein